MTDALHFQAGRYGWPVPTNTDGPFSLLLATPTKTFSLSDGVLSEIGRKQNQCDSPFSDFLNFDFDGDSDFRFSRSLEAHLRETKIAYRPVSNCEYKVPLVGVSPLTGWENGVRFLCQSLSAAVAKRTKPKNRMQMMISPTKLIQHQCDLRELEGSQAKFSFEKCVLGTPAVLESVLGKSSAIPVCLSEFCLSHDVTCALCYCNRLLTFDSHLKTVLFFSMKNNTLRKKRLQFIKASQTDGSHQTAATWKSHNFSRSCEKLYKTFIELTFILTRTSHKSSINVTLLENDPSTSNTSI